MTVSKNFQPLSSGEVLSVSNESQIVIGHSTFRVSEFTAALKQLMLDNGVGGVTPETIDWLTAEGITAMFYASAPMGGLRVKFAYI